MEENMMGEMAMNNEQAQNIEQINNGAEFKKVENLPTKVGFWTRFKNFWLQDMNVELTPKQQKVEDEINEFLHQEVTWQGVKDFLFQEVTFGKKNQ